MTTSERKTYAQMRTAIFGQGRPKLLSFLSRHAGEKFTVDDLCAKMKIKPTQYSERNDVICDLARLVADGKIKSERVAGEFRSAYWVEPPKEA